MVKINNCCLLGLLLLGLAACTVPARAPAPGGQEEVDEVDSPVHEPVRQDDQGVQTSPLPNPAVKELQAQADAAGSVGDFEKAAVLLERALRIQPQNPETLQLMAELQIHKEDYQQALNFAVRSYDLGPRMGDICNRNWRTIGVAKDHLDDENGSRQAQQNALACMNARPRRQ